jgi:hypothetical protein
MHFDQGMMSVNGLGRLPVGDLNRHPYTVVVHFSVILFADLKWRALCDLHA